MDWERLKFWKNTCSAVVDADDVKAALDHGQQVVRAAAASASFLRAGPEVLEKLNRADEALDSVKAGLEKAQNVCKDIQALERIHRAIQELDDPGILNEDSDRAARAFGELFAGFGRLAHHLPSPANEYARILEKCGDFFADMRYGLVPDQRPGSQGRMFRDIFSNKQL